MPRTVNGVGTWYYGKVNRFTRRGTCDLCGAYTELRSYDTTLYFVLFFVPLIPLRGVRVLDECRACERHSAVKLKEWRRSKAEALAELEAALAADPGNVDAARALAAVFLQHQDEQGFLAELPRLERLLKGSAEGLELLGMGHAVFGRRAEASSFFQRALALEDTPERRQRLVASLALQRRAREAREALGPLPDPPDPEQAGLLEFLIESAQAAGEHAYALELVGELAARFPEHDVAALRRTSEKREEGDRVRNVAYDPPPREVDEPGRARAARLIGPGIAACLFLLYVGAAYREGQARTVYLLNGTRRPYTVELAGRRQTLPPSVPVKVTLAEGELRWKLVEGEVALTEEGCRLETSFWSRPVTDETFVLNPDGCALLLEETAVYSSRGDAPGDPPTLHANQTLFAFTGIDHVFAEFPRTLKAEKGSTLRRVRLGLALPPEASTMRAAGQVYAMLGEDACLSWLERELRADPGQDEALDAYSAVASTERALELIRPHLAKRPVEVDWHRAYQTVRELRFPNFDLTKEYRALVAEREDPEHLYLLARVLRDTEEAERLLRRAAGGAQPSANAQFSLSYLCLAQGRLGDALDAAREALRRDVRARFRDQEEEVLLAVGRGAELRDRARAALREHPQDLQLAERVVLLLAATGQEDEVTPTIQSFLAAPQPEWSPEVARPRLEAQRAYGLGDLTRYAAVCDQLASQGGGPALEFRAALARRELAQARDALARVERPDLHDVLALVVLAGKLGDASARDAALGLSDRVGPMRAETRELLAALRREEAPDLEVALRACVHPTTKRLLLVALGQRFPAARERLFTLARKLDYAPDFPHCLVREVLSGK
ncbi:MAG: hypothetical protein AB7N76_36190 [Planctomycetota bacterium]